MRWGAPRGVPGKPSTAKKTWPRAATYPQWRPLPYQTSQYPLPREARPLRGSGLSPFWGSLALPGPSGTAGQEQRRISRAMLRQRGAAEPCGTAGAPALRPGGHAMELPKRGVPRETLFDEMKKRKDADADWEGGRTFSLIYPAGEDVDDMLAQRTSSTCSRTRSTRSASRACADGGGGVRDDRGAAPRAGGLRRRDDLGRHREHPDGREGGARPRARREGHRAPAGPDRSVLRAPCLRQGVQVPRARARPDSRRRRQARRRRPRRKADRRRHRARGGLGAELPLRRRRPDPRARRPRRRARHQLPHRRLPRRLPAAVPRGARRGDSALRLPRPRRQRRSPPTSTSTATARRAPR